MQHPTHTMTLAAHISKMHSMHLQHLSPRANSFLLQKPMCNNSTLQRTLKCAAHIKRRITHEHTESKHHHDTRFSRPLIRKHAEFDTSASVFNRCMETGCTLSR